VQELLDLEAATADAGLAWILQRVQRSLRLAGVVRASERTIDRSSLLTRREADILRLAAEGLTDPEIARRLGLGVPTVRRHVGNAVLKLGVPTRVAAVAAATAGAVPA
jgi:DNA-binding CsgD family transcriptional regulator